MSSSADGRVKVWNQNGVEITSFQPHQSRINSCDLWAPGVNIEEMEQGIYKGRAALHLRKISSTALFKFHIKKVPFAFRLTNTDFILLSLVSTGGLVWFDAS